MGLPYATPDVAAARRTRRRVAWVLGLALLAVGLVAGLVLYSTRREMSDEARETLAIMVRVWDEKVPSAKTVPMARRVEPEADGGEEAGFADFRFRLPRAWRISRTEDTGPHNRAIWLRHADGAEVLLVYRPQQQSPGDSFSTEMFTFLANYCGSEKAAKHLLSGFPSDLAVFEAAYALTPERIDVPNATQAQLRRDIPLFAWKTSTRGEHRLDGPGMTAYVGARQLSGQRNGPPRPWRTFICALDERGQFRGTIFAQSYRYPDAPGDALIRELVATARFGERPVWPATAPTTRPATTAATVPDSGWQ